MNEMTITSAQYVQKEDGVNFGITATIEGQELHVPLAAGNRHYDEIMRQVEAGTLTIQEAE
jgi:hypothetical protein